MDGRTVGRTERKTRVIEGAPLLKNGTLRISGDFNREKGRERVVAGL